MYMFSSASRVVLIIVAVTLCGGFLLKILDPKDFMILASMVFAFYYTKPVDKSTDEFVK